MQQYSSRMINTSSMHKMLAGQATVSLLQIIGQKSKGAAIARNRGEHRTSKLLKLSENTSVAATRGRCGLAYSRPPVALA